jgi:hypothetical protein
MKPIHHSIEKRFVIHDINSGEIYNWLIESFQSSPNLDNCTFIDKPTEVTKLLKDTNRELQIMEVNFIPPFTFD